MEGKRLARRLVGLLIALVMTLALAGPGCKPKGIKAGDVNLDGQFDQDDVDQAFVLITQPQTGPDPDRGNVALPCGGDLDMEDMRRLRAALAARSLGIDMESQCHDVLIGKNYLPDPPLPPVQETTLDHQLGRVAEQVPAFAGLYLRDGVLHLVVTDTSQDVVDAAEMAVGAVFGDRFDGLPVQAVQGRYPFADLERWRDTALDLMMLSMVYSVDLDEVENTVTIGLSDLAHRSAVQAELQTLSGMEDPIPDDAVLYEQVEQAVDYAFTDQELQVKVRPLEAGTQTASGGLCTMGIVAKRAGQLGFVTNSHCTSNFGAVDGSSFGQPDMQPGNILGNEVWDAPAFPCMGTLCTWADAAFVALDPGIQAYRGRFKQDPAVSGYYTVGYVRGEVPFPVDGEQLHKVGRTTGQTLGEVDETCTAMQTSSSIKLCQYHVDGAWSNGGDSGSPVFKPETQGNFDVDLYGFLHAGPSGGGDSFWFTALGAVENLAGNLNTLNADEPPTVAITTPAHGSSAGPGIFPQVTIAASFFDLEDGTGCSQCEIEFVWPGGSQVVPVSTGSASVLATLHISGGESGWLYAIAKDSWGNTATDSVYITTGNAAPTVEIVEPVAGGQVTAGFPTVLIESTFDLELFGPLPCNALTWTSSGMTGGSVTGCTPAVVFPNPGIYLLTLEGVDPANQTGSHSIYVQVVGPPTAGPPLVTIKDPDPGQGFGPNTWVAMTGYGLDPDGKSPIQYEWILVGPNGSQSLATTSAASGADTPIQYWNTGWDPGSCGGTPYTLELHATDADNETSMDSVNVTVTMPPC
ncbi:MAG: hypothetical protein ACQGVK_15175 [Myxococcota bacterium]